MGSDLTIDYTGTSKQIDQNDTPEFQAGQLQMKAGDPGDTY